MLRSVLAAQVLRRLQGRVWTHWWRRRDQLLRHCHRDRHLHLLPRPHLLLLHSMLPPCQTTESSGTGDDNQTFAAILQVGAFLSLNRFCVLLLQHPRDWFPACLLPPNQRTTTRQPDLAHLATLVSLPLTLDHLRIIFLRFLSTKPNPQLTMNMPCDIRG